MIMLGILRISKPTVYGTVEFDKSNGVFEESGELGDDFGGI